MATTITKILFRRGLDSLRRTGGGPGVVLNLGEPGYCTDTFRLYVGDGSTVGGNPVGIKNHGTFTAISGTYNGYNLSTFTTLTTNGIDVGDFLYDNTKSTMYYVSAKPATAAFPPISSLGPINLIGSVSAYNGLESSKAGNIGRFGLDTNYFSINDTFGQLTLKHDTIINGILTTNQFNTIHSTTETIAVTTINASLINADVIQMSNAGFPRPGDNNTDWYNCFTTVNSNSSKWTLIPVISSTTTVNISTNNSSTVYTASGAVVNFILPPAGTGLNYTFFVQAASGLKISPRSTDTIRLSSSISSNGSSNGFVSAGSTGSSVSILAISNTQWVTTSIIGSWTVS